ncbi:MAG: integrase core domain-containing protein, partial [Candidatus Hydrogenedentes bacterium]|nr:integrase core domain-containing protein [Candidatus Hydrogenedentota bacterium]
FKLLDLHGAECSMSRKEDCWNNAPAESFFGKLKTEHIGRLVYANRREAEQELFWYIEVFYNRKRRHAALGYLSLLQFGQRDMGQQVT